MRPFITEGEHRVPLTLTVSPEFLAKLRTRAKENYRSISQEVEFELVELEARRAATP